MQIQSSLLFLFIVPSISMFSAQTPNRNAALRLSKPLIGDDGRIYTCSHKIFYAFESNGSIAWSLHLDYQCNAAMAPVHGGRGKIYLVAENRVLKINFENIATSGPSAQVVFGPGPGQKDPGELVGIAVSTVTSSVFINIRNRGLFAYSMRGRLAWSLGPVLYQYGYRQGCRKTITDCYFSSVPVIDQCEASIYVSNNEGELYSLPLRSPHFKWIQDFSSLDKVFTITSGNNGRLYVTIPTKALVLALDVSSGNVLWQASIGPLSTAEYDPVVDTNGWLSIGSLDGYLYSFSPTGDLKKFPKSANPDSVIQVTPVLDCSGYGVYISQTDMEGKVSRVIGPYTYVSAMKPISVTLTLLVPATGSIIWSESYPGKFSSLLFESDLQHFVLDEAMLVAFLTASRTGNPQPCRSKSEKLASSCSQARPKLVNIYMGNKRTIVLSFIFESVILIALAGLVQFCCIFWRKQKLQGQNLGNFLEKRRSLQLKKKAFDRTITELEQKAAEEAAANDLMGKLGDLIREREGIEKKLSTTYSLGRDPAAGPQWNSKRLLPLYDGKARSYSFPSRKESVTIFHTVSVGSSRESTSSSSEREFITDSDEEDLEKESLEPKGKAKAAMEVESSSSDDDRILVKYYKRSPSEPASSSGGFTSSMLEEQKCREEKIHYEGETVESLPQRSERNIWLKKRRTLSSTN